MNGGFIVIDRKLLEWKYFRNDSALRLWITLLIRANWKDGELYEDKIPRGSLATSYRSLADSTGLSESTIRRWLTRFENDAMIERKVTPRYTIIKVLKYNDFQDIGNDRVNNLMNNQMNTPVNNRANNLMNSQVNNDRTKEPRNKETNIPPKPPRGGTRRSSSGRDPVIVIDTPAWYKRQQAEKATQEHQAAEPLDDEIITRFEKAKMEIFKQ